MRFCLKIGIALLLAALLYPPVGFCQNISIMNLDDFIDPRNLKINFGKDQSQSKYLNSSVLFGTLFNTDFRNESGLSSDKLADNLQNPDGRISAAGDRVDFLRWSNNFHFSIFQAGLKFHGFHWNADSHEFRTLTRAELGIYLVEYGGKKTTGRYTFFWEISDTANEMMQNIGLIFDAPFLDLKESVSGGWGYSNIAYHYGPEQNQHIISHKQYYYISELPDWLAIRFGFSLAYGRIGTGWTWGTNQAEVVTEISPSFLDYNTLYISISPYFPDSGHRFNLQVAAFFETSLISKFF